MVVAVEAIAPEALLTGAPPEDLTSHLVRGLLVAEGNVVSAEDSELLPRRFLRRPGTTKKEIKGCRSTKVLIFAISGGTRNPVPMVRHVSSSMQPQPLQVAKMEKAKLLQQPKLRKTPPTCPTKNLWTVARPMMPAAILLLRMLQTKVKPAALLLLLCKRLLPPISFWDWLRQFRFWGLLEVSLSEEEEGWFVL